MSTVRYRRAMILLASAGGNTVPVIARLVQADEDTARDVIHRFNEIALANSSHSGHTVRTRALHAYLRWRSARARHPDVLAVQRRERARARSEKGIRWGGRPLATAA
ncbi:hypothetical protein GCM10010466_15820 [Planomonospora alba]